MRKIENPKRTAEQLIQLTENKTGVIISYYGERFDVERAEANGFGAVQIYDHRGTCHGLSVGETVEVLGTFNL